MAAGGRFSFDGMEQLQRQIEQLDGQTDEFITACAKELAARLLAKVIKRTPVGDYSREVTVVAKKDGKKHKKGEEYKKRVNPSGKKGGTLRRGWTGGQKVKPEEYVQSLSVQHFGDTYVIEIVNPVEYASYVEFGHRQEPGRFVPAIGKKLKKGWVEGKKMLSVSEEEIRTEAPAILEQKLKKRLRELME